MHVKNVLIFSRAFKPSLLVWSGFMNEEEEDALIDLMICAIQRAAEAKPPIGRISVRKVGTLCSAKHFLIASNFCNIAKPFICLFTFQNAIKLVVSVRPLMKANCRTLYTGQQFNCVRSHSLTCHRPKTEFKHAVVVC